MKTTPTSADVNEYVAGIADPRKRADAETLMRLLGEIIDQPPIMWGQGLVGFGQYHYRYASGREGDWFILGFAARKQALTLYMPGYLEQHRALLDQLGKHTTGKGCLYVKSLADVDLSVLRTLLEAAISANKQYAVEPPAPS
jgi:hypothetical protein